MIGRPIPMLASPTFVASSSAAIDSNTTVTSMNVACPAGATVGDFVIVCSSNGGPGVTGQGLQVFAASSTGTAPATVSIAFGLVTASHISSGFTHTIGAASTIQMLAAVFTNPNKTVIPSAGWNARLEGSATNGNLTTATKTTGFTEQRRASGLRVAAVATTGISTWPATANGGTGTFLTRQDAYFWQSVSLIYKIGGEAGGSETVNTPGSTSGIAIAVVDFT